MSSSGRFSRRALAQLLVVFVAGVTVSRAFAGGDELPPPLDKEIVNPKIPTIVDATITGFTPEGYARLQVNAMYKPAPRPNIRLRAPNLVRGYLKDRADGVEDLTPMKILVGKDQRRFLLFMQDDLLYSTYNNRWEIREEREKQLVVFDGRKWKPLKEITRLIPQPAE